MRKYGVFIGRFQPFHKGHEEVVQQIIKDGLIPFIIIGSACQSNTDKNPKSFSVRSKIIQDRFPTAIIEPMYDFICDLEWATEVEKVMAEKDCVIYYKRKEEDCTYGDALHYIEHLLPNVPKKIVTTLTKISGTTIREACAGVPIESFSSYLTNGFLTIKDAGGYFYTERKGKDSVAFILRDVTRNDDIYCLINEYKPPIYGYEVTAFGGSLDCDLSLADIVRQEVREEAGYSPISVEYLGKRFVSTQMNQYCHLFIVDVDSSRGFDTDPQCVWEAKSKPIWVSAEAIKTCSDWKSQCILLKVS